MAYYGLMHNGRRLSSSASRGSHGLRSSVIILAFACAIAGFAGCSSQQPKKFTISPEEKAYLQNVQVTANQVTAAQNFLGHTVTTLHGTVTNNGNKNILYLEVRLTFMDIEGKPAGEKRAYPVSGNTLPLKAGQSRSFEVHFDQVPADWNQAPPKVTLVRVLLAGD